MVASAANWLGGALCTIAKTDDGDRGALNTSLSGDWSNNSTNEAVEEASLLRLGVVEGVAYNVSFNENVRDNNKISHTALDRAAVARVGNVTRWSADGASSDKDGHGGGEDNSELGEHFE